MANFKQGVIKAISIVPYGKVASYSQIALMVGLPRAARQVGWILNSLEESLFEKSIELPWWRIINNKGRISIKGTKYHDALVQKSLLEKEGIEVNDDLTLNIEKYRYRPDKKILKKLHLDDEYIYMIIERYGI